MVNKQLNELLGTAFFITLCFGSYWLGVSNQYQKDQPMRNAFAEHLDNDRAIYAVYDKKFADLLADGCHSVPEVHNIIMPPCKRPECITIEHNIFSDRSILEVKPEPPLPTTLIVNGQQYEEKK